MKGEFLTEHISVRVTPKERIQIQEQSEISGLTISEYSRRRICGRRVLSRIEREMIFELRRQGGLMKLIFNESHGMYSDKTANAIDSINSFVSKLERIVFNDK